MKDNFLIIPDFPNYEINSELLVRNKKTGKFLKPVLQRGNLFVGLHNGIHCKRVSRSLKYCRELALAATAKTIFYPVPSLGGKYEISKSGVLRSAARKYALKLDKKNAYCVTIDKQNKRVSLDILPTHKCGGFRYQQPKLPMKAKSYKVSFAGRCPALFFSLC